MAHCVCKQQCVSLLPWPSQPLACKGAEAVNSPAWLTSFAVQSSGKKSTAGPLWSEARRENALSRDFTVNGMLYDPFAGVLYDYVGGVEDCRKQVLRTISDPVESFSYDSARMLRAVRLAGRAGVPKHGSSREGVVTSVNDQTLLAVNSRLIG